MKKIFIFTGLFFLVIGLGFGCVAMLEDEINFECTDDSDCPSGQVCKEVDYSDICKPEDWCSEQNHCYFGQTCDVDAHECLGEASGDSCGSDDDCDANEECHTYNNTCYVPTPCPGYEGSSDCCDPADPCDWADDSVCDCDGTCSWDSADCA